MRSLKNGIKGLYNKFIVPGSPLQLNISHQRVAEIEEFMKNDIYELKIFKMIILDVHIMIFDNSFQKYVRKGSLNPKIEA